MTTDTTARITDHPFTGDAGAWNRDECEFSRDEVTRFPDCWAPRLLHADPGVDPRPARAEQAQPGGYPGGLVDPNCARLGGTCGADCRHSGCQRGAPGYTPPAVGAPTWPQERGTDPLTASDVAMAERAVSHVDRGGFEPRLDEAAETWDEDRLRAGFLQALDEGIAAKAERDRLCAVIAAAYVDLLAGRVDEALAALRAAGGQP